MKIIFTIIICITALQYSFTQSDTSNRSSDVHYKRVIPGIKYDKSWFGEIFAGEHWRDLWTTPIKVEVLDTKNFGGGIFPMKKGGGLQTKSLRFKGNDGNEYKFRSVDKDPSRSLPPEWQNSYYADLLQDQVSIGLPGSSLITYPLMKATNILSVEPNLVILPNDNSLGVFQKEFGDVLGVIELNPRAGKKYKNNFAGADKVINGFDIFEVAEKDNDEQVDQKEFLKARLMDVFLGDRDRHAGQWQWAGYKDGGKQIWKPIPRDRDYAFGRYDGLVPTVSGWLAHSLVGFSEDYPRIVELTWSGRHLDRRFLNELDKKDWDSISNFLKSRLTDEVLLGAVRQMPPEMFAKKGNTLLNMLKKRRDNLNEAADDFYSLYSDVVDVYGSNKDELADINIIDEKQIEVSLFEKDKHTGKRKKQPYYNRIFNSNQTHEIRLNMLGKNDNISIKGKADNCILLRIIGGPGNDTLINNSGAKIKFYDSDAGTRIKSSGSIYFNDDKSDVPKKLVDRYEPSSDDRYGFWAFAPVLNFNSDDGWIIGGGPSFVKYGFRAVPYLYYLQLTGAYATTSKDYDFKFYGDFNKLIHNARVQFYLGASQLDFNRYYGIGNESTREQSLADNGFYKTNQGNFVFRPVITFDIAKQLKFQTSFAYRMSDVKLTDNTLVGQEKPYGIGKINGMSFAAGLLYDTRSSSLFPKKGYYVQSYVEYFPKLVNYKYDFTKVCADAYAYFTLKTFTEFNLMLRAGGENIFGTYPFFEAATIGGLKNLRGYSRERFQGDASLFGQSELRIKLASLNLLLPGTLGISALSDAGRVFAGYQDSKKWHSTYGGGVWFEILNTVVMNFYVARSPELTKYYFTFGLGI